MHDEELLLPDERKLDIARNILQEDDLLIYTSAHAALTFAIPVMSGEFGLFVMLSIGCNSKRTWVASAKLAIRSVNLKLSYSAANKMGDTQPLPMFTEDSVRWNTKAWAMSASNITKQANCAIKSQKIEHVKTFKSALRLVEELKARNLHDVVLENHIMPSKAFDGTMRSALALLKDEYKSSKKALTAIKILRSFRR